MLSQRRCCSTGSFELPALPPGSITIGGGDNWTPSDASGVVIISNGNGFGNTSFGTQYLGLDPSSSDAQTIAGFDAGVTYSFSVDFADALGGPDPMLTIILAGVFNGSQTFTAPVGGPYGSGDIPFTSATFSFTALTSGSETITLTDASLYGAIAIDNVVLNVPQNVPDTGSTLALLGLSLGGVLVGARRWKLASA